MDQNEGNRNGAARTAFTARHRDRWRDVMSHDEKMGCFQKAYYARVCDMFRYLIPEDARVLELGCGRGDLLASLEPSHGVGVDFCEQAVETARERHPDLEFIRGDALEFESDETFDYIVLSDMVNDVWDVQTLFARLRPLMHARTRVVVTFLSHLWDLPLRVAAGFGLARRRVEQNWLAPDDVRGLAALEGLDVVRHRSEILFPVSLPLIGTFLNTVLAKLWPFKAFTMQHVMVLRRSDLLPTGDKTPSVSIIVAARNEQGNIRNIFERVPDMGSGTELVFVEGGSSDDTYGEIERQMKEFSARAASVFRQTGVGKGDAVRLGFEKATGDILMILDADLTVPPEDLPRFYDALVTGKGEFVNGVRLVYPMEKEAMRFCNKIGNKFFSLAFSWLLEQPIKDTLCGTKVLFRSDYERIAAGRAYFGDFDPFGDFDLIFGAAKQGLKIVDVPVRYRERVYGDTNISRWSHGWLLLKMVAFAARRVKFV